MCICGLYKKIKSVYCAQVRFKVYNLTVTCCNLILPDSLAWQCASVRPHHHYSTDLQQNHEGKWYSVYSVQWTFDPDYDIRFTKAIPVKNQIHRGLVKQDGWSNFSRRTWALLCYNGAKWGYEGNCTWFFSGNKGEAERSNHWVLLHL
jgi:hypothetical protein